MAKIHFIGYGNPELDNFIYEDDLKEARELFPFSDTEYMYVAGGFVRELILGTPPLKAVNLTDVDLFLTGNKYRKEAAKLLAKTYGDPEARSQYAVTFRDNSTGAKVQLISKFSGKASAVIKDFDYTACQVALTHEGFVYIRGAPYDIRARQLVPTGNGNSTAEYAILRLQNYINKGFAMSPPAAHLFVKALRELPSAGVTGRDFY